MGLGDAHRVASYSLGGTNADHAGTLGSRQAHANDFEAVIPADDVRWTK